MAATASPGVEAFVDGLNPAGTARRRNLLRSRPLSLDVTALDRVPNHGHAGG
jgi:hypothetical protein